jgi:preprotein translocase subunit SecB
MAEISQPLFNIQRIYMKDASLEIPNAPRIFLAVENPAVEVQMNVAQEALSEGIYEVAITVTITTRSKEEIMFLIEVKQAGIFEIRGVPEEQLDPLVGVVCPNIVFPYLRSNVADLVSRAGFPPIHLAEVNFEAFYQQRKAAVDQQQAAAAAGVLVGADGLPVQ